MCALVQIGDVVVGFVMVQRRPLAVLLRSADATEIVGLMLMLLLLVVHRDILRLRLRIGNRHSRHCRLVVVLLHELLLLRHCKVQVRHEGGRSNGRSARRRRHHRIVMIAIATALLLLLLLS